MSFWDKFWSLFLNANSDNYALLDTYDDEGDEDEMMVLPEKRPTFSVLKNCIYFISVILLTILVFCLLAIIVASDNCGILNQGDWKSEKNKDINVYIHAETRTTVIEPEEICEKYGENKLLVLIFVCSAVSNFEQRQLIRDTWGSYENYKKAKIIIDNIKNNNNTLYYVTKNVKNSNNTKLNTSKSSEFTINNGANKDHEIVMEENIIKAVNINNTDFKLIFFVGLPNLTDAENNQRQKRIENESKEFRDIVQEGFVDTCKNLTLKSVMMLKWVLMNCRENVRYIFKVEEYTFVNVHNLVDNLRRRAKKYDCRRRHGTKEYLLIGHLHCGLKPERRPWIRLYSPNGDLRRRSFPRFLSGAAGYVMSMPAAAALYLAAQTTPCITLEDVFITGYCAQRSIPRVIPHHDRHFSDLEIGDATNSCAWYDLVTAGHGNCSAMRRMHDQSLDMKSVLRCKNRRATCTIL